MGKGLSYWKKWGVVVNYCWNYGPSKLLLHFIEYRLDQLNIKYTKTVVNSTIQYFEGCSRKKCLLKVWCFLVHPPQNGGLAKFLRNWTVNIWLIFSNFTNVRHLIQWKCIIFAKSDLPIAYSVCGKVWFTINGPSKMLFFNFCLFPFSKFQMTIVKNLIMDFEGF